MFLFKLISYFITIVDKFNDAIYEKYSIYDVISNFKRVLF